MLLFTFFLHCSRPTLWFSASLCVRVSFPKSILGNKRTNFEFKGCLDSSQKCRDVKGPAAVCWLWQMKELDPVLCRRMSTNYSSEGRPGINTAVFACPCVHFLKDKPLVQRELLLVHEPCAINDGTRNKCLRKFVRSWNKIWTVKRHLQATFWHLSTYKKVSRKERWCQ